MFGRENLLHNLRVCTRVVDNGDGNELVEPPVSVQESPAIYTEAEHLAGPAEAASSAQSTTSRFHQSLVQLLDTLQGCEQRDDPQTLDNAISGHRDAEARCVVGQPEWIPLQGNLAAALFRRFERKGQEEDLDEAIRRMQNLLRLTTAGQLFHSLTLNNLAVALMTRFKQRGDVRDIKEAINCHRGVLLVRPIGHPDRPVTLNNLALAFELRFENGGDENDLDEAIHHCREGVLHLPIGHSLYSDVLDNLANLLMKRFRQRGNGNDIDEAILYHSRALSLTPVGHPRHASSLNNLACTLMTRFDQRADGNDIDDAIRYYRDALLPTPTGAPLHLSSLNNLADALLTRFQERGNQIDLAEAIYYSHKALSLEPIGNSFRPSSLCHLAKALVARFGWQGQENDLDNAVQCLRDALLVIPTGHLDRPALLNDLAAVLTKRFDHRGDGNDLNSAIRYYRDALSLIPVGHLNRSTSLNTLMGALARRIRLLGGDEDADEALHIYHTAQAETLPNHPCRWFTHYASADLCLALCESRHSETRLHKAMDHYQAAADFELASPLSRLRSSLTWVKGGEKHNHASRLTAYTKSLQLLDAHISTVASVSARHQTIKQFPRLLSVDAASCALRQANVPLALELLEQGRALLWQQVTRFRTPIDELCSRGEHAETLVKKFRELSLSLSKQPTSEPRSDTPLATIDAEARQYRHVVDDWNKVVADIRKLDGFSRFLMPPLFSDLQEAACEGPVIVLIASQFTCDAIIVLRDHSPIHILLDTTLQRLVGLANQLRKDIFYSRVPNERTLVDVLRQLWDTVMLPVVSQLEKFTPKGSRIWWCPTSIFTMFPLHAVGEYRKKSKRSVAQLYISSYTPSLSALIEARRRRHMSSPTHFAAIGQAQPDGHRIPLLTIDRELDEIESLLSSSTTVFTKLTGPTSTREEAHRALRDNQWVHFSCHGSQNYVEPFKSSLAMRDGALSLLDIINTDLSKHEFVFLSACKTAFGDSITWDEAIHLAAGLQFMGVKSVIGTLRSVCDDIAYRLVSKFYAEFCDGNEMDASKAARALHNAYVSLGREKVPLEDRVMFIHIGI